MASKYNPYSDVKNIYDSKGQYDAAIASGDTTKAQTIANNAQKYYQNLRDSGYLSVADELGKSNYQQSKSIVDKWAKMGKTSTRDYMYSLGKSHGMSSGDIDKLIGWDNQTGEVSFGGKKIGTPDTVVDGVFYWNDTSVLDNAFKDYVDRSGTVRDTTTALNQENESLFKKYSQEYDDLKNTNPFKTDEAKAILGKYDLAGLYARDNAVASGGASNGGNIDSYASANAMRQQASLVNQGQMAVLEAHQQKIDNVRGLLSDMGVNIDRVFNQSETAKNNDVARKSEIASVTGTVPTEWTYDSNIYLNSDGTVKDEFLTDEFDNEGGFTTIINNAKAKLATTTDATERANLMATINAATQAKALKTFSSPKYSKYAHEVTSVAPTPTEEHVQFQTQNDTAYKTALVDAEATIGAANADAQAKLGAAEYDYLGTLYKSDSDLSGTQYKSNMEYQTAIDKVNASTQGEKEILGYTAELNGLQVTSPLSNDGDGKMQVAMNKINSAIAKHENGLGKTDAVKRTREGVYEFKPPQYQAKAWKYVICRELINAQLSVEDIGKILYQFDLSTDDFLEVQQAMNK